MTTKIYTIYSSNIWALGTGIRPTKRCFASKELAEKQIEAMKKYASEIGISDDMLEYEIEEFVLTDSIETELDNNMHSNDSYTYVFEKGIWQ